MSGRSEEAPEPDRLPGWPHPREAESLIGQTTAEGAFLDAWTAGRLHHAWLLTGTAGIGKATLAYRIARALLAEGPANGSGPAPNTLAPPPDCPVMRRIRAGGEPRLAVLRRSIAERTGRLRGQISVDDVRALKGFLGLSAADGGWRAVIVDAADEMTVQAANALLKSLEEPPPRTAFLLVAHAPGRLLPTIRSRTRRLDCASLNAADLAAALRSLGAEEAAGEADGLAALAGGSVGGALRLAEGGGLALYAKLCGLLSLANNGFEIDRRRLVDLAEGMGGRQGEGAYALALELGPLLLARLARAAAGAPPKPAIEAEARLLAHARSLRAATLASGAASMAEAGRAAAAVSLDPSRTVIDTWLGFEAALARPPGLA
ncbi:MAG: DNA polymerase III subunit delta' [Pseudomonadota bacterium]